MNRTDRLYALVEELRAVAPSSRTARELSEIYEVSTRTIERDILALQEAGVPILGAAGRRGGYSIDPGRTLPPVNFTPAEALAVAVALADGDGPFAAAGRMARNKVLAALSGDDLEATRAMAERVRCYARPDTLAPPVVPLAVQQAIAENLMVTIGYRDRHEIVGSDPAASETFYSDLFGCQFGDGPTGPAYRVAAAGDGPMGGIRSSQAGLPETYAIFSILVPDVGAVCDRITELGGKVLVGPQVMDESGLVYANVTDPDGNHFGIFTPPAA